MNTAKHSIQDFADAKYNVLSIGTKKVLEAFPGLGVFPELRVDYKKCTSLDNEKVLKYVILMYMDNILKRSSPDLVKRKREAALLAGFEIDFKKKKFPEALEKIMRLEDPEVNKLIIRILRLNNNNAFEQVAVYEEARARQMYKLLSPSTEGEKTKEIHENIRRMTADIMDLEKQILMEEKRTDLTDAMYYEVENIQLGIRPEEIASAKRAGAMGQILFNVYQQQAPKMANINKKRGRPKKNE